MFLPRGTANPTPPDVITSPDKKLRALIRNLECTSEIGNACAPADKSYCPGGVLLRAEFGAPIPEEILGTNLFSDPSFAYGTAQISVASGATLEVDPTVKHSGTQSLKITSTSATSAHEGRWSFNGTAGKTYKVSFWAYSETVTDNEENVAFGNTAAVGGVVVRDHTDLPAATWVKSSLTVDCVADGAIYVYFYGPQVIGGVKRFDDVNVWDAAEPEPNFTGDSPALFGISYRWVGRPGLSASERFIPGTPRAGYISGTRVNLSRVGKMNSTVDLGIGGGATIVATNEWFHDGLDRRSIKVTATGSPASAAVYPINDDLSKLIGIEWKPGAWYQVSVWVNLQLPVTGNGPIIHMNYSHRGGSTNFGWASSQFAGKNPGTTRLVVEFQVPDDFDADLDLLSARCLVGAGAAGEFAYFDDLLVEEIDIPGTPPGDWFSDETPDTTHRRYAPLSDGRAISVVVNPLVWVRFERRPGILVRSGNDAWAPGGVAYAYDDEASFGIASSWVAYPVFADGTLGDPSDGVALALPESEGCYDSWIKSTDSPQFDQQVFITADTVPTFNYGARNTFEYPQGSPYPVGTIDRHMAATTTLTAFTVSDEEEDAMHRLLDSGHLLFQTALKYHIPDFHFVVGDYSMTVVWVAEKSLFARQWSIPLTTIDRPDPYGAPLVVPGEAYEDMRDETYAQLAASWNTYRELTETLQQAFISDRGAFYSIRADSSGVLVPGVTITEDADSVMIEVE